jgi:hypothetical protein
MTTISFENAGKPAPKWYRVSKRIIYLLVGSSIASGTLTRFGVSDADALLFMGWLTLLGEIAGIVLGNGEVYAKVEDLKQ